MTLYDYEIKLKIYINELKTKFSFIFDKIGLNYGKVN